MMADITLVVGNKNYSSWSLRSWLPLVMTGAPFEEIVLQLHQPATRAEILRYTPSGRLPVLIHDGLRIWDSLAINEFLAETYPVARLWPAPPAARARARTVSAEMHAGFAALRESMPMDMRARRPGEAATAAACADIERITALWRDCRAQHGAGGPFLFGHFTIADAMFAPVVSRFITYGVQLDPGSAAYRDAVWSLPPLQAWAQAAAREPWTIEFRSPAARVAAPG